MPIACILFLSFAGSGVFSLTAVANVVLTIIQILSCRSCGVIVMVPCSIMTGSRLGYMRESTGLISSRLIWLARLLRCKAVRYRTR